MADSKPKHLDRVLEKQKKEQSLIKKGKILDYLNDRPKGSADVAIAADLNLSTALVRKELKSLIEVGKVRVKSAPQTDLCSAGLVYEVADGNT